jgi:hypothetical protein
MMSEPTGYIESWIPGYDCGYSFRVLLRSQDRSQQKCFEIRDEFVLPVQK